jgi:flagellar L-ring protein precursor FlgH
MNLTLTPTLPSTAGRWFLAAILALSLLQLSSAQIVNKNFDGEPGSLWNSQGVNPFLDRTARREGDIITIIISETSVANYSATTTLSKQDNNSVNVQLFNNVLSRILRPFTTSDNGATNGTGTTNQTGKLTARLTGVVKQVMPNGTMVIEGARTLMVNREVQTFKLSGVVRRDDIRSDNTVMSENIAQADIRLEGKGAIYNRQRRGLLTQILDWMF